MSWQDFVDEEGTICICTVILGGIEMVYNSLLIGGEGADLACF